MSQRCRLCLKDDSILTSVSDNHEGLPISVIMMIVCPVTIKANDNFPKFICEECLEVVVSAFKLRAISCKNEQFLLSLSEGRQPEFISSSNRKYHELSPEPENPISIIKYENFCSEDESVADNSSLLPFTDAENPVGKFTVKCDSSRKSLMWKYAGPLCDSNGHIIYDNYVYCSVCMAEGKIKRYLKKSSTSTVLLHLSSKHGIGIKPKIVLNTVSVPSIKPAICDYCNFQCANKYSVLRHILREHIKGGDNINDDRKDLFFISTIGKEARVACDKASDKSAFAWNYFGRLVDAYGEEIEELLDWNYCRLCLQGTDQTEKRYAASSSTSSLLRHLRSKHGLFEEADEAGAKRARLVKEADKTSPSETVKVNADGFGVFCYKASTSSSMVFQYIGRLVDVNGTPVEEQKEFNFCKICVVYGTIKKFRKDCSTSNLRNHLKKHGLDTNCSDKHNLSTSNLKPISEKPKYCQLCDKSFEIRKSYLNHMRRVHMEIESSDFICHICSKSFRLNHILLKHMQIHDGKHRNCPLCPAKFTYLDNLKRHMKIHDSTNLTRYQCDICSNSYSEMRTLKYHILRVHLKKQMDRKHCCTFCDRKFINKTNLQRHVLIHTGEKPNQCTYCDAAFTQKNDLMKHLQKNHVGDALYNCTIEGCTASFRLKVELREHYRIHYQDEGEVAKEYLEKS